eukprot:1914421-Alexandrium_andersonii.AAC.1
MAEHRKHRKTDTVSSNMQCWAEQLRTSTMQCFGRASQTQKDRHCFMPSTLQQAYHMSARSLCLPSFGSIASIEALGKQTPSASEQG